MRYRKPKDYETKLHQLKEEKILCSNFDELCFENRPLFLEIGMGRGDFLTEYAERFSPSDFLGIERQAPLLVLAGQKILEKNLGNVKLMNMNANQLEEILPKNSVSKIFLNFSDPWSKPRYQKRRLTHIDMLRRYEKVMKTGAMLAIKTDNRGLFEFSIAQIEEFAQSSEHYFEIVRVIEGLHDEENKSLLDADDPIFIMTEYEKKFVSLQKTIFAIECILI